MSEIIMEVKGVNGQIELYSNRIVIKRKGILSKMTQGFFKGDKEILLSQISAIQIKKGTSITNGYIQFTLSGGNESTKGIMKATQDENSVMIPKKENENVEKLKNKIYELQSKDSTQSNGTVSNGLDEIEKLKKYLDDGIITQEEFEKAKKKILGI